MYDEGLVSDKFMLEILHNHTNVIAQPAYNSPNYSGINPYALGFRCLSIYGVYVSTQPKKTRLGSPISRVVIG